MIVGRKGLALLFLVVSEWVVQSGPPLADGLGSLGSRVGMGVGAATDAGCRQGWPTIWVSRQHLKAAYSLIAANRSRLDKFVPDLPVVSREP